MIGLLLALAGLGLGLAVLAVGWVVVNRGFGAGRLMVDDLDIYRSANELIQQHGEDAPTHAAMHADAMLERGEFDDHAVWLRILKAVKELQSAAPGDRAVH